MKYYAVRIGRKPGIYNNWNNCKEQVDGFKGAIYQKFNTKEDAQQYIDGVSKEQIDKSNAKLKELTTGVESLTDVKQKIKNTKLTYIYYYNYPGFNRPNFQQNKWRKYYYVFTDGSMRNNSSLQFKSGYGVFFYSPSISNISSRNNQTHNYCEVTAVEKAIEKILDIHLKEDDDYLLNRQYIIVSDSQYCIRSLTQYMFVWKQFGWKRHTGKEIHYVDKWKNMYNMLYKLDELGVDIGFLHVKSHMKQPNDINGFDYFLWYGNRCADHLAIGKSLPKPPIGFNPFLRPKPPQ